MSNALPNEARLDIVLRRMLLAGRNAALAAYQQLLELGDGATPEAVWHKPGYSGSGTNAVTTLDVASQNAADAVRLAEIPVAGIIGEENNLRVPCTIPGEPGNYFYCTVDGGDGTNHFTQCLEQGVEPDGFYVMVGVVVNGRITAAGVLDIFDRQERITRLFAADGQVRKSIGSHVTNLSVQPRTTRLLRGKVVTRGDITDYHPLVRQIMNKFHDSRIVHAPSLSIAYTSGLLWDEAQAGPTDTEDPFVLHLQGPGYNTGWDNTPIQGIDLALGITYLRPSEDGCALQEFIPPLYIEPERRAECWVKVHRSRLPQLAEIVPLLLLPVT